MDKWPEVYLANIGDVALPSGRYSPAEGGRRGLLSGPGPRSGGDLECGGAGEAGGAEREGEVGRAAEVTVTEPLS
jgi:hypothetical protein